MHQYGVREVEKLLRLPRSTIRALIDAGFVSPARGPRKAWRFSFQDLIVLRTAQALVAAKVPAKRITRSVRELRRHLPAAMQVLPNATVGAEVRGVDLARADAKEIAGIKQAWYRHDVLVFRGQKLTDDDLLAFSKHFGTLDPPPNQGAGRKSPPGYPDIYVVSNVLDDYGEPIGALGDGEAAWHTDMSPRC